MKEDTIIPNIPQFVNFPNGGNWSSSGEGGLTVVLAVKSKYERENCNSGVNVWWLQPDVCFHHGYSRVRKYDANSPLSENVIEITDCYHHDSKGSDCRNFGHRQYGIKLDAYLLIGSYSVALYNEHEGEYFIAAYNDLTEQGRALYDSLEILYGKGSVDIITLLDT